MERSLLPREIKKLTTAYGEVQVKLCGLNGQLRIYPEYNSIAAICRQTGDSYLDIYHKLQQICREQLMEKNL